MRRARRIETLVVACMVAFSPLACYATAVDVQPNNAASSPRLKYLPEDYFAVVQCNVGAVMQVMTAVGAQQNPQFAQFEQYLQMAKGMTGIDIEKEVTEATLFAAGEPGPGASATVVISGTFNNATVQQHIAQMAGAPAEYKGQTIYSTPGADVAFPEPSTILIGEPDRVRAAIDRLEAGAQTPAELKNILDRTPATSVVWAAFKPSTLVEMTGEEWQSENEDLYNTLSELDCASAFFTIAEDGLLIKALGYAEDGDGAESIGKFLADAKNNLLHEEGTNVLFTSLLIFSDVNTSDNYIEGALRLTGTALRELWNTRLVVAPE